MKINMEMIKNLSKKPYVWAVIGAIANLMILILWLCGAKMGNIVIFCILMSAILGNVTAAIWSFRNDIIDPIRDIITDILSDVSEEDDENEEI